MAGLPLLPYLPPGWTETTYQNATSAEYNALPEELLQKLMERKVEEARQQADQILQEARAWRAATHGIATLAVHDSGKTGPPAAAAAATTTTTPAADHDDVSLENAQRLVRRVEAASSPSSSSSSSSSSPPPRWAEMGFLVFRTYYADEPLWERFQRRFGELVDAGILAALPAVPGLARVRGRVKLPLVSDYALVDLGPGGVAHIYRDSVSNLEDDSDDEQEEEVGEERDEGGHLASLDPGLRMPMCLMVDEECLRSLDDGAALPFVKAVDARLATNREMLHYEGWFKVSVRALMPHFYAAVQFYEPVQISAAVDGSTGIWTDMGKVRSSRAEEETTTDL
ncbi:WW/Rsp5/WWP domain protein [Cordyceps fumosorosea ARSEF 2679]|uniref:WW/Rsp5/WWP domain protein n=1 Tax=Cordyceps fumosorosea (strain ARSEF 2679) TaxID=1081104 RepID=A0A168CD51_CORFA|nr:WW/Rsp5/WWP domain protein [Cordyceps fumosorosea ARSEF 2679]OAA71243.1 WW/Rsp5/WWP domain protein [Cordyceps fumosorosea ARSEF 2679]